MVEVSKVLCRKGVIRSAGERGKTELYIPQIAIDGVSNALSQDVFVLRFFPVSSLHRINGRHDGKQHVPPSLDEPYHISIMSMGQQNPSKRVGKSQVTSRI